MKAALLVAGLLLAGCSGVRWGNYARREKPADPAARVAVLEPFALPSREEEEEAFRVRLTTDAPPKRETFSEEELKALYYYDLGPKEIDVSDYPAKQQENYAVFRKACSHCHTLARPRSEERRAGK